jgi:hypothetical protein
MPPIRRGDLYRDRLLGFGVFVILDGVFGQELAISPRETIDIVRDGALVVGASSMGAIRAAECWPAGVRGVGSVYRLFRRGALTSDAEVAVAFSPEAPYLPTSVPLVNVRYAMSRCLRQRLLDRTQTQRAIRSAADIFFAERTWPLVLKLARLRDKAGALLAALAAHDLKRLDAIRALKAVRHWVERQPRLLKHDGTMRRRTFQGARAREATSSMRGNGWGFISRQDLWRWLVASGRYRRYALHGRAVSEGGIPSGDDSSADEQSRLRSIEAAPPHDTRAEPTSAAVARLLAKPNGALARVVWAGFAQSGDRDTMALTLFAMTKAAAWGRHRDLAGERVHRQLIEQEVARAHGFATWRELRKTLRQSPVWPWIEETAHDTAIARQVRQQLFARGSAAGDLIRAHADQD